MAKSTTAQRMVAFLAKRASATAPEIAKGIKANVKTVRNILGNMMYEDYVSTDAYALPTDEKRKCRVTGVERGTYALQ